MAAALLMVGAAPAHAYTCGYNDLNTYLSFQEVKVTFKFEEECTDGNARIKGTVYDVLCDNRAAQAHFTVYDTTGHQEFLWSSTKKANNGCGSSSSFTATGASPGTVGWQLRVITQACNFWSCSTPHIRYYYG